MNSFVFQEKDCCLAHCFRTGSSPGRACLDGAPSSCLDGAPSSRVWLRLCERFGCGHVFGLLAREIECPAGPDAGPHGSSPNQQNALVMAPAVSPGFRAVLL